MISLRRALVVCCGRVGGVRPGHGRLLARSAQTKVADESSQEFATTVRGLVSSRLYPSRGVEPVKVESLSEAYKIQTGIAQCATRRNKEGGRIRGWKVGASNQAAIDKLGLTEAFRGPLFSPTLRRSPSTVAWEELGVALFAVEAEFAFTMSKTIEPRSEPFTEEEVWQAVSTVHPAIEIAASRSPSALPLSPDTVLSLVADYALHGVLVVGDGIPAAQINHLHLSDIAVTLSRQTPSEAEGVVAEGKGANVLGSPLTSLSWLVNALSRDGITLEEGAIVTTGAAALLTSPQVPWGVECTLEAKLKGLGNDADKVHCVQLNMPKEGVRPWEIRD